MSEDTRFQAIVEHMTNPVIEKKATFIGAFTAIMVLTWLAVLIPLVHRVWQWGF